MQIYAPSNCNVKCMSHYMWKSRVHLVPVANWLHTGNITLMWNCSDLVLHFFKLEDSQYTDKKKEWSKKRSKSKIWNSQSNNHWFLQSMAWITPVKCALKSRPVCIRWPVCCNKTQTMYTTHEDSRRSLCGKHLKLHFKWKKSQCSTCSYSQPDILIELEYMHIKAGVWLMVIS